MKFSATVILLSALAFQQSTAMSLHIQSGACVDNWYGGDSNGNKVTGWDCNGGSTQEWDFIGEGGAAWGYGVVGFLQTNGKCLDRDHDNNFNGGLVQLWDCNWSDAQKWFFTAAGHIASGSPQAQNRNGACLNLPDSRKGDQLIMWDCTAESNELFSEGP